MKYAIFGIFGKHVIVIKSKDYFYFSFSLLEKLSALLV